MAGRGSKQPANSRPPGQVSGQGNPPVAKCSTPVQAGSSQALAHAGKPTSGASGQAKDSTQANRSHRGRWGDEGGNRYSDGHFRGCSSSGGGRGFPWHNNGFNAPPGQFVPGPSGPTYPKRGGFRQNWIGRGGGKKPRPPVPTPDQPAELNDNVVVSMAETTKEGGAGEAQVLCMQDAADTNEDSGGAGAEPTAPATASLPVSAVAATACGGALDIAADAQMGFIPRADQPDEARV
ncbi:hypothetical protein D1007_32846 [Hordeum vulgare]|nr:hypothetical protein D1007_32846 [Hordeum vulgare]